MIRRLMPKAYAALLHYVALLPLYLLPAAVLMPDRLWIAAVLPIPALLLTGWAGLVSTKRRTAALVLCAVLMAAGCFALFSLLQNTLGMLLYLPCLVTMLTFMPAMTRPAHQEWTVKQLTSGMVLHIAAQFLKSIAIFTAAATPLSWLFALYLLAFLFTYNHSMLVDTTRAASGTLVFHNRMLLIGFCLLALLLANIQAVATAIRAAIGWVVDAVITAVLWLISLFSPSQTTVTEPVGAGQMEGFFGEASEPSMFARVTEIILIVVAALVAAALLYLFFRHVVKLLRRVLRALMERLQSYRRIISADYNDASESLLDWGDIRKTAAERIARVKQRFLPTPWERLSPAQRVRRVYALLLRRADAPDPARTAREMLASGALRLPEDAAANAASLYDRARYSAHPISAQEADALRKQARV